MNINLNSAGIMTILLVMAFILLFWYADWSKKNNSKGKSLKKK